ERPARGVTWSYVGLGAGQTAAGPLAGAAAAGIGLGPVFILTGLVALLAWTPWVKPATPAAPRP
ncbi:hypothetical protein, partial [Streptomyces malaysiensis]|uniref:hypothetical protein n=1 Tax=Streptomyces malaysiensis TaxID=92644 RepID=UPI001F2521CC